MPPGGEGIHIMRISGFRKKLAAGFTLVEICVVLIITGLLLAGAVQLYGMYLKKERFELNQARMEDAQEALADYFIRNGKLPCPAPRNLPRNAAEYGRSVNSGDCFGVSNGVLNGSQVKRVSATRDPGFGLPKDVLIGFLPARTLGLPDEGM